MFLKAFFRVLGCNPRKRRGFIGLKVETPQNGVVLVAGSLKRRCFGGVVLKKKKQAPQNDVVLGCSDLKKKKQ